MEKFMSQAYQKQKPFAGFLPGIAGKEGLPMWVFYINRGQAISSFGIRDKNGAMAEFYPANLAYAYVHQHGFRTFIKYKEVVYECFQEKHTNQTLTVLPHQIVIEEEIVDWQIKVRVRYATLPNMPLTALIRQVEIINLDGVKKDISIIDGLSQMLPAGIDNGGYKAVSNLLQSWMEVEEHPSHILLKLRASTADSSEVKPVEEGNFYTYIGLKNARYIYDYKAVFGQDSSFQTPYQMQSLSYKDLIQQVQAPVNQVPSAFVAAEIFLEKQTTFYGLFGFSQDHGKLVTLLQKMNEKMLADKFVENELLIESLTQEIKTKTNEPMFDAYLEQCYLDNILRGGYPVVFETKDGPIAYHLYSRKHGDLERDYNFFSLEPSFLSQGNGAFRDVLQNRRNDLYFHPEVGHTTIAQFASFIQADGYNPLSIEGVTFTFAGQENRFPNELQILLHGEFTPGQIAMKATQLGLPAMPTVIDVLRESHYHFKATYGEGYWGDHFTYFLDLIETYLDIYPDQLTALLEKQFPYFVSPATVKPRHLKYVLKGNKVRQYHSVEHHSLPPRGWLLDVAQQPLKTTLFAKMLTLVLNKFSQLDPDEMGLMYEADRPGWNDAMNGLPGLFGSGVSELIELHRLVQFLQILPQSTEVLQPLSTLIESLLKVHGDDAHGRWDQRMNALEQYRQSLTSTISLVTIPLETIQQLLHLMNKTLTQAIKNVQKIGTVLPTYFTYEAKTYQPISTQPDGTTFVKVNAFSRRAVPAFLEAPARLLSAGQLLTAEAQHLFNTIKKSSLYDAPLKIYKTSVPLLDQSMEIGRIRAFTPGWLERESAFIHMTYKYMLGLLKAKLYPEFFTTMRDGMTCFMDPKIYGRSPLENSSFIATTNNPDKSKHGQGFYARLSGSTAEVISMWKLMLFGPKLFFMENQELTFKIAPTLPANYFNQGRLETKLFASIDVSIHYEGQLSTYDPNVMVSHYELVNANDQSVIRVNKSNVQGDLAHAIRRRRFSQIRVYMKGGSNRPQ